MDDLRLILLVAGVLFIGGIAAFEWWRNRRPRAYVAPREETTEVVPPQAPAHTRAPLPEIGSAREPRTAPPESLPVIEIAYQEVSAEAARTRRDPPGIALSGEVAVDRPLENTSTQAILRAHDEPEAHDGSDAHDGPGTRDEQRTYEPHGTREEPNFHHDRDARDEPVPQARRGTEPYIGQDDEVGQVRVVIDGEPVVGPKLSLAWPKEAERRIVTLRVMPRREPRFPGRSLRQAFAASGFWHGPLDIFHLPDPEGRVVLSAAALAQPGTFDPSIMDSQRFSGLNLFAVLPGPLPERETFEELVHAARALAERLEGSLTDQHGDELTAERIGRLRQSFEAPPEARVSGES